MHQYELPETALDSSMNLVDREIYSVTCQRIQNIQICIILNYIQQKLFSQNGTNGFNHHSRRGQQVDLNGFNLYAVLMY